MEVAFVGGAVQVVCAIINNVLGKKKTEECSPREEELCRQVIELKHKVFALEMELAELHHKMQRDEREARQRRLKMTVESLQLQIRKDKLDRRERSVWALCISAIQQINYLYVAGSMCFWYLVGLSIESSVHIAFHA
ncbi:unnamed protein product [Aphanomyces euteiches]